MQNNWHKVFFFVAILFLSGSFYLLKRNSEKNDSLVDSVGNQFLNFQSLVDSPYYNWIKNDSIYTPSEAIVLLVCESSYCNKWLPEFMNWVSFLNENAIEELQKVIVILGNNEQEINRFLSIYNVKTSILFGTDSLYLPILTRFRDKSTNHLLIFLKDNKITLKVRIPSNSITNNRFKKAILQSALHKTKWYKLKNGGKKNN